MLFTQIIALVVVFFCLLTTYAILKKKKFQNVDRFLKICSISLAVIFFFRFMLDYDVAKNIFALSNSAIDSNFLTIVSLVLNWFLYAVNLLICLYPFFKNSKYATVVKYFGTIVALLCCGFLPNLTKGIVFNAYNGFNIRTLFMGIEVGVVFAYSIIIFFENSKFKVSKKDALGFVYILGMLLATMPPYFISAIFGHAKYAVPLMDLNFPHRIILYLSILIPIILFVLLRKKDSETCRGILLYISLGTLLSFSVNFKFEAFTHVTNWPLHLCNTAMYIIPLCLFFKWDKLFYFTYFINVLGAFLAMAMPNYNSASNIISTKVLTFYINHYIAFFMPLLIVPLRVYKRPKLKQFIYSMIGFGI